ncbi:MAG: gamma-glutamyl-gamma-aminobutyrate hydrolase family protein [Deltaproteobacteria bacterium]|nr:gamma-glutamyl-gamma-aminobutyrate hydrolase family protein [Deltaproteobacteria bacterium]
MADNPLIGLNMSMASIGSSGRFRLSVPMAYSDAVAGAGGIPLCLPVCNDLDAVRQILGLLDGMVFIGGADYRPDNYGGRPQPENELNPERQDRFDMELAKIVLQETELPVLGICGGCQLINIALGGALVQDIKTEWNVPAGRPVIPHSGRDRKDEPGADFRHAVILEKGSLVARTVDASPDEVFTTNSVHHQAVHPERLGRGLRASAWSEDGIIEAIEPMPDSPWAGNARFVLGVQWHPERMQNEALQKNIFRAFIQAAMPKT